MSKLEKLAAFLGLSTESVEDSAIVSSASSSTSAQLQPTAAVECELWLMGRKHTLASSGAEWPQVAVEEFRSLFWFTYRYGFPPIKPTILTSDAGWGCMLRTAQMLFAEALAVHFFGRGSYLYVGPEDRLMFSRLEDVGAERST